METKKIKKQIDKAFDIDYPKDNNNEFVGSLYDVYEKAFKSALKIKEVDKQLDLADAQFIGFKHGKWGGSDIVGLVDGMGLTKKEWLEWKKKYPQSLDENDFEEINNHFKDKSSNCL